MYHYESYNMCLYSKIAKIYSYHNPKYPSLFSWGIFILNKNLGGYIMYTEVGKFFVGYKDETGVVHKEFEYREMDGYDEEALAKPKVRNNGSVLLRTLLSRCIVRIGTINRDSVKPKAWDEIIQSLVAYDQDYAFMQIRVLSLGEEIKVAVMAVQYKNELTASEETPGPLHEFEKKLIRKLLKKNYKPASRTWVRNTLLEICSMEIDKKLPVVLDIKNLTKMLNILPFQTRQSRYNAKKNFESACREHAPVLCQNDDERYEELLRKLL